MSDQPHRREALRRERLDAERRDQTMARRRLLAGYLVAGLLTAAVVTGVVVVIASGGGSSASESGGAFGPHYDGLQQRIAAAAVSTMGQPASAVHIHPQLAVYANDEPVEVPANIGIDPAQPPTAMAGLHTHDASGTIHDEGMPPGATLGQFFEIWGVPFSRAQLGPYRADGPNVVRIWVNGHPSQAFGALPLEDGQKVVVAYGPRDAAPPPAVRG